MTLSETPEHELELTDGAAHEAPPAPVVPDRADAPVSEIAERFLRAILTKVPLERIEELHLFSPLRQGGAETGIAVIAARVPVAVPPVVELLDEPEPELPLAALSTGDEAASGDADAVAEDATEGFEEDSAEDSAPLVAIESAADDLSESVTHTTEQSAAEPSEVAVPEEPQTPVAEPVAPIIRHTVFTARYRLVQKGPERGKWESDVVAEAEAPLVTVEMVVRGVQRRAGEESDTTRYSAAQIARALRVPLPAV